MWFRRGHHVLIHQFQSRSEANSETNGQGASDLQMALLTQRQYYDSPRLTIPSWHWSKCQRGPRLDSSMKHNRMCKYCRGTVGPTCI